MFYLYLMNIGMSIPYYYNPNMHSFGNIGIGGKIHSEIAPFVSKMIDNIRYNGVDIRKEIMKPYVNNTVLDLCCGVGISTCKNGIGIDTSNEMLAVAKRYNKDKNFYFGNAENFRPKKDIDIVSCMFAMHEMPPEAQIKTIQNALIIANKEVIFVDIAPDYKDKKPSKYMLAGEPYLLDYLDNIDNLLFDFDNEVYIDKHVHIWRYKK